VFFDGRWDVNDETVMNVKIKRASDLTYPLRFPILHGGPVKITDLQGALDSSISLENYRQTSYGVIKGYVFQANDQDITPVILPTATYLYESMPGIYNETWHVNANFLNLFREKGVPGHFAERMIRGSLEGGMQIPYVTHFGDIWKFQTDVRGDVYHTDKFKIHPHAKAKDYNTNRLFPKASLTWRYPFVRYLKSCQWLIEPAAMVVTSSQGLNKIEIPDEDSPLVVVEPTNLFLMNRFYGYDRVDSGHRFVYGFHDRHYFSRGRKVLFFFGQSIRLDHRRVLPKSSGEDRHASNFVSSIVLAPASWLEMSSRLMFNRKDWTVEVAESSGALKTPWLTGTIGHEYYDKNMTLSRQRVSQVIWGVTTPQFYKWTFSYSETLNLANQNRTNRFRHNRNQVHHKDPRVLARAGVIQYHHECLVTTISIVRTGYRDRDLRPDTKVLLQLDFKNLGSFAPINILGLAGKSTDSS
jgi:LPS-assembly protein